MLRPAGTNALGTIEEIPTGPTPFQRIADDALNLPLWVVEFEARRPGGVVVSYTLGLGTRAAGTLALEADDLEATDTFRASDRGYYTRASDLIGVQAYPPLVEAAFEVDRSVLLNPGGSAVGASWGTLRLSNPDGEWDAVVAGYVNDGRPVRILFGAKSYDAARGLHVDPRYSQLVEAFRGLMEPWFLTESTLDIPLRDPSWYLETLVQSDVYLGTGTYEGTAELTGKPKPMARGGTAGDPIRNVEPVLIDPAARIYQYTDGPGTVVTLYERGGTSITFQANTSDLYSGTTNSGEYRTDNSRGLFQLGATAAGQITADVTGQFPTAGVQTTLAMIARYLLTEDIGVPAEFVDLAAFTGLDAAYPYTSGIWIGPGPMQAVEALSLVLGSIGGKLIASRRGRLRPFVLRAIPADTRPADTWTTAEIVRMVPRPLPGNLSPPTYRWRVGYQQNHTVQLADLAPAVTDARRQFLREDYRFGTWIDADILTRYRRPNDPEAVEGILLASADATSVADALGALWGERRRLYDVTLWLGPLEREIGDVVSIQYPLEDLDGGKLGRIVGEQLRTFDGTVTVQVLV